jgi:hypothetical protein
MAISPKRLFGAVDFALCSPSAEKPGHLEEVRSCALCGKSQIRIHQEIHPRRGPPRSRSGVQLLELKGHTMAGFGVPRSARTVREFIVNLRERESIGLIGPPAVLSRADEMIE